MNGSLDDGNNAVAVLLRNPDQIIGQVGFVGLPTPALLDRLTIAAGPPLVITEHAGLYRRFQETGYCRPQFGYHGPERDSMPLDTLVIFVPKARQALTMQLALARALLKQGGRIVLVGGKREGIAGAARQLQQLAPQAYKVDSARHCQVWVADEVSAGASFDASDWLTWHEVALSGQAMAVAGMPGIFSDGRLDEGSARLLDSLDQHPPAGPVLDFACGAGVIGTWLQLRYPELGPVDAVDVQAQAVTCTRETYQRNGARGEVVASDGLPADLGRYQSIVTNPPFHSGVRTDTSMTERFLRQARSHLRPGGELRLVANRFLPYQSLLDNCVGPADVLFEDRRFSVYQSRVAG